jgi:threonine/homoserine/homoserine lactone efflux protein
MSDLAFLARGWLIGLAIAAPVGPIGILCIRRTLADGRFVGFFSGMGAATADMLYGTVAAFSITALQNLLTRQQLWLRFVGGLFLLVLGVRMFFSAPEQRPAGIHARRGRLGAYLSTLGLTLTNPATILSFTAIFAGLRLGDSGGGYTAAASMVAGVFIGSASWWLLLSGLVGALRERFTVSWMRWVNRLAGILVAAFGIGALVVR